jgi:hypothetical protein
MRPSATLSGRIVWESASDGRGLQSALPDPQLLPPRARIVLDPASGAAFLGVPQGAFDPKDRWAFEASGLLPAPYFLRVYVDSEDPNAAMVKSITWNGRDHTLAPFDASAGSDMAGVVVTLTRRTIRISGTVQMPEGQARATVIAFPVEPDQWSDYGLTPARLESVAVDADRSYRLSVPAGDYYLVAVDRARAQGWYGREFLQSAAARMVHCRRCSSVSLQTRPLYGRRLSSRASGSACRQAPTVAFGTLAFRRGDTC